MALQANRRAEFRYSCNKRSLQGLATDRFPTSVGNQQKWDTFVKERSGGNGRVLGLPEQAVVAFALG